MQSVISGTSPLFSIIIPCYNSSTYILKALASIKWQLFLDFETLIVDDQSSCPDTLKILGQLESCCHVFYQQHRGAGAARNLAIRHARGKYIIFLDSDDMLFPRVLEAYSKLIYSHMPNMIFGNCNQFPDGSNPFLRQYRLEDYLKCSRFYPRFVDFYNHTRLNVFLPGHCIRRDLFNHGAHFLEQDVNGEDLHLYLQLVDSSKIVHISHLPTYAYRSHSTNSTSNILRGVAGINSLLIEYNNVSYPQDITSNKIVQSILSSHARSLSIISLQQGYVMESAGLYLNFFWINITCKRAKYIFGFWVRFFFTLLAGNP